MIHIIESTCWHKDGQNVCIASIAPNANYLSSNAVVTIDLSCKIYHNKVDYTYAGNTAVGIPSIQDSHFYYPNPV